MATGQILRILKQSDSWVSEVAFSPDGKLLFISGTFLLQVWNLETGMGVHQYGKRPDWADYAGRPTPRQRNLIVSPDEKMVAVNDTQGVRLWDISSGLETQPKLDGKQLNGPIAFTPDSKALMCYWSHEKCLCLLDITTGKEISRKTFAVGGGCSHIAFAPDGQTVAGAQEDCIRIWSVPDFQELAVLRGHKGSVAQVAFSADGKTLVSGSEDTTLLVWDVSQMRKR
jgi:WD40 repeat protein